MGIRSHICMRPEIDQKNALTIRFMAAIGPVGAEFKYTYISFDAFIFCILYITSRYTL